MKECDNSTRKVHISSNFILSISLLIMFDTLVLRPSLHCNTPLHFITHHHTLPKYISLHFTTRHPTRLHNIVFGLTGNYLSICSSGTLRSLVKLSIAHNHWLWTPGPLTMGPRGCHETWVTKHQTRLRNIPEERRRHIRREDAWNQGRQLFVLCERITNYSHSECQTLL